MATDKEKDLMVAFQTLNNMMDEEENKRGTDTLTAPMAVPQDQQLTTTASAAQGAPASSPAPTDGLKRGGEKVVSADGDKPSAEAERAKATRERLADPTAILRRNIGAQGQDIASGVGSKIKETQAKLQESAAQYRQQQEEADTGFDREAAQRFFESGEGRADLESRLRGETYQAPARWSFEYQAPTELEALTTEGGQEQLRRQRAEEAGRRYTAGMAGLDTALARRQAKDFSDLLEQSQGLRQEYGSLQEETAAAQDAARTRYDAQTKAMRDYLEGLARGVTSANVAELAQARETQTTTTARERERLQSAAQEVRDAEIARQREILRQEIEGLSEPEREAAIARFEEQVAALPTDISQYIQVGAAPELTTASVTSAEEAQRFNRIMELLGSEERIAAGQRAARERGTFDEEALRLALRAGIDPAQAAVLAQEEVADAARPPMAPSIREADPRTTIGGGAQIAAESTEIIPGTGVDVQDLFDVAQAVKDAGRYMDPTLAPSRIKDTVTDVFGKNPVPTYGQAPSGPRVQQESPEQAAARQLESRERVAGANSLADQLRNNPSPELLQRAAEAQQTFVGADLRTPEGQAYLDLQNAIDLAKAGVTADELSLEAMLFQLQQATKNAPRSSGFSRTPTPTSQTDGLRRGPMPKSLQRRRGWW